ncbi:MAG: HIT domain-containing protein [Kiritimatiellaeota bacterium]|nr:HIT domain-containing protein [Kiritimatiellota bacterium]
MNEANRPLWAPWRIDFIRSEKDDYCFLCLHDEAKEQRSLVVFEGETVFVILNKYPYNSGHLLVAPYAHKDDISDLTPDERSEIMETTIKAKEVLQTVMRPDGFNIGFNLGEAAGAGVPGHIHMHIVPRWSGDTNFMPVIAGDRVVPEALAATRELLAAAWKAVK